MRFDHLMAEAQSLHRLCIKHLNNISEHMRHARRAAYRFARKMMEIEEQCHNEFLDFVMTHKLDIDAWMDERFAPIEQVFNQDRQVLSANIRAGMTEKEYLKHGDLWTIHRERVHAVRVPVDIEATEPSEPLTPEQAAAYWKTMAESLVGEVRELRRRERALCAELDLVKRRVANLTKIFKTGSAKAKAQ